MHVLSSILLLSTEGGLPRKAVRQNFQEKQALDATWLCSYASVFVPQDRVEGAALLEAAELRGDDSDADLNDSDSDSEAALNDLDAASDADSDADIVVGSSDEDSEVHGSEAAESDEEGTQPDGIASAAGAPVASEVEADVELESRLAYENNGEDHEDQQSEGSSSDDGLEEAADSPSSSGSQHSDIKQQEEDEGEKASGRGKKRKAHSLESDLTCSDSEQDKAAAESPITAPHADEEEDEGDGQEEGENKGEGQKKRKDAKPKLQPAVDSLQTLKRQLAVAKGTGDGGDGQDGQAGVPIEWGRVLSAEDFDRIKQLRHRCSTLPCHDRTLRQV